VLGKKRYLFGVETRLDAVYDGSRAGGDFNYTGEWMQVEDQNGNPTYDMHLPGTTNNVLDQGATTIDSNGLENLNGAVSGDDSGRKSAQKDVAGRAHPRGQGAPMFLDQVFTFVNTAVTDTRILGKAPPGAPTQIEELPFYRRYLVYQSFYRLEYDNYYIEHRINACVSDYDYYIVANRYRFGIPSAWSDYRVIPGAFDVGVKNYGPMQYYSD
jgi:hypothetical protein